MNATPGNYVGRIQEHGTETSKNGLPLIWFRIGLVAKLGDDGEPVPVDITEPALCRVYLAGGDEEKTQTAIRMARQALRLCGFDPDAREVSDLDDVPTLLAGNEVPVRVSEREYNGRFYTNYDIALPRSGVGKDRAKSLTSALRAAKANDEAPVSAPSKAAPAAGGNRSVKATDPVKPPLDPNYDDIPF